jgi:hypothetical protein
MKFDTPVKASWFYTLVDEKTKFNWFCYEFACVYFENLMAEKNIEIRKWKLARTKEQIAEFCAYYAKRLKKSVEDRLAKITDATELDEEFISDYCHENTLYEDLALLAVAAKAWDEHTLVCVTCPTRCISERHARCEFFDCMERGGYFS